MENEIIIDPESLRPKEVTLKYYPPLPDIEVDPASLGKTYKGIGGFGERTGAFTGWGALGAVVLIVGFVALILFTLLT